MTDKYANFAELKANEPYGIGGYHILCGYRHSPVISIAIHGGGIEPGTTELAIHLAVLGNYAYYCFEGWKPAGNVDLHITSTNFDEPKGLELVANSLITISFHGYADVSNKRTKIGGLDRSLRRKVYQSLTDKGFSAEILPDSAPIAGVEPNNITNRNKRGRGVQLEISTAQRNAFFGTNTRSQRRYTQTDEFYKYVEAIKRVLPY